MEESNEKIQPVDIIENAKKSPDDSELTLSHDNPVILVNDEQQEKSNIIEKSDFDCTLTKMDSFLLDISEERQDTSCLNVSPQASDKPVDETMKIQISAVSEENVVSDVDVGEKENIAAGFVSIPHITIECANDKDGSLPDLEKIDDEFEEDNEDAVVEILNRSRSDVEKSRVEKINFEDSLIAALQGLNINTEENNETFLSCDGDVNNTVTQFLINEEEIATADETLPISDDELKAEKPVKQLNNSSESSELDTTVKAESIIENNKTMEIVEDNNGDKESESTLEMPAAVTSCPEKNTDGHSDDEEFKSLESYSSVPHVTEPASKEIEEPNEVFYETKEEAPTEEIVEKVCHFIPCRSLSPFALKVTECDSIRTPVKTASALDIPDLRSISDLSCIATESDDDELLEYGQFDEEQSEKFFKQCDLKVKVSKLNQHIVKLKLALLKMQEKNIRENMKYTELIHRYNLHVQKLKENQNVEDFPIIRELLQQTKQELVESENKYKQLEIKMEIDQVEHSREIEEIKEENRQHRLEFVNGLNNWIELKAEKKIQDEKEKINKLLEAEQLKTKTLNKYLEETFDQLYKYKKIADLYQLEVAAKGNKENQMPPSNII